MRNGSKLHLGTRSHNKTACGQKVSAGGDGGSGLTFFMQMVKEHKSDCCSRCIAALDHALLRDI